MTASHDSGSERVGDAPTHIDPQLRPPAGRTAAADSAAPANGANRPDGDADTGGDTEHVQVIEEGVLGARLRRPLDLVRMMVALLLIAITVSFVWLAATTT